MISIIIPTYNHKDQLARTLESITQQTFSDYEVIVVDDGSTDETDSLFTITSRTRLKKTLPSPSRRGQGEVLLAYYNLPVLYIRQHNAGANAARNRGFAASKGEYVIFCDADVTMTPHMLVTMRKVLHDNPSAAYAYASFQFGFKTFPSFPFDGDRLKRMPYIHTTSLIRRTAFPGFDPSLKRLQDWDLYLTMLEHGDRGVLIPEALFTVEARKNGMSEWLPSFAYKLFPFLPAAKKYKAAERVIREKHRL